MSPVTKESVEDLIAKLCTTSPTTEVQECLRIYEYGKTLQQLEKDFNKIRKAVIQDTLIHLGMYSQQDNLKPELINNLICRIQNLLPENCSICNLTYAISVDDKPLLPCSKCGQDVHKNCFLNNLGLDSELNSSEIKSIINPHNLPGVHYLCPACEEIAIPKQSPDRKLSNRPQDEPIQTTSQSSTSQKLTHRSKTRYP